MQENRMYRWSERRRSADMSYCVLYVKTAELNMDYILLSTKWWMKVFSAGKLWCDDPRRTRSTVPEKPSLKPYTQEMPIYGDVTDGTTCCVQVITPLDVMSSSWKTAAALSISCGLLFASRLRVLFIHWQSPVSTAATAPISDHWPLFVWNSFPLMSFRRQRYLKITEKDHNLLTYLKPCVTSHKTLSQLWSRCRRRPPRSTFLSWCSPLSQYPTWNGVQMWNREQERLLAWL